MKTADHFETHKTDICNHFVVNKNSHCYPCLVTCDSSLSVHSDLKYEKQTSVLSGL